MINLFIRCDGFCVFERLIQPSENDIELWLEQFVDENKHNRYGPAVKNLDGELRWYLSGVRYDYLEYIVERNSTHNYSNI